MTCNEEVNVEIPDEFICPITLNMLVHPVVNRAGHNFEREAILNWVAKTGSCPLTREPLSPSKLVTNFRLQRKIKAFREEHGIPEITTTNCKTEQDDDVSRRHCFVGCLPNHEVHCFEALARVRDLQMRRLSNASGDGRSSNERSPYQQLQDDQIRMRMTLAAVRMQHAS